jgi:lysophospholipase L1-like esterase
LQERAVLKSAKIALGLVSLCVSLLVAEVLLSWLEPQVNRRPEVWHFDAHLGWKHLPSSSGWMVGPEYEVEMRINKEGLRDQMYAREKAPAAQRILLFGDSFVEGWGVRVEDSIAKKLEEQLRQDGQDRVEVINFGVAGYGSDQELLFFEELGSQFEPDQVVVFFYVNDLINNMSKQGIGAERGYKPYFRFDRMGRLQLAGTPVKKVPFWDKSAWQEQPWTRHFEKYLHENWHLYVLLNKALTAAELDTGQRQKFYQALYGVGSDSNVFKAWELTGSLLQIFQTQVEKAGAELVLVYVPAIVQVEEENWQTKRDLFGLIGEFDLQRPNWQLKRQAARYDIPLLDLSEEFIKKAQDSELYFRESHWNPQGHALAARLVADFLRQRAEGQGP